MHGHSLRPAKCPLPYRLCDFPWQEYGIFWARCIVDRGYVISRLAHEWVSGVIPGDANRTSSSAPLTAWLRLVRLQPLIEIVLPRPDPRPSIARFAPRPSPEDR